MKCYFSALSNDA